MCCVQTLQYTENQNGKNPLRKGFRETQVSSLNPQKTL